MIAGAWRLLQDGSQLQKDRYMLFKHACSLLRNAVSCFLFVCAYLV